jgi:hypothetical protein
VISAQHAWWFPEKRDPGHGWDESNVNVLTDNAYSNCDPAMGATSIRTLLCNIRPEDPRGAGPDTAWAEAKWNAESTGAPSSLGRAGSQAADPGIGAGGGDAPALATAGGAE